jgi:hypothetical protein
MPAAEKQPERRSCVDELSQSRCSTWPGGHRPTLSSQKTFQRRRAQEGARRQKHSSLSLLLLLPKCYLEESVSALIERARAIRDVESHLYSAGSTSLSFKNHSYSKMTVPQEVITKLGVTRSVTATIAVRFHFVIVFISFSLYILLAQWCHSLMTCKRNGTISSYSGTNNMPFIYFMKYQVGRCLRVLALYTLRGRPS